MLAAGAVVHRLNLCGVTETHLKWPTQTILFPRIIICYNVRRVIDIFKSQGVDPSTNSYNHDRPFFFSLRFLPIIPPRLLSSFPTEIPDFATLSSDGLNCSREEEPFESCLRFFGAKVSFSVSACQAKLERSNGNEQGTAYFSFFAPIGFDGWFRARVIGPLFPTLHDLDVLAQGISQNTMRFRSVYLPR